MPRPLSSSIHWVYPRFDVSRSSLVHHYWVSYNERPRAALRPLDAAALLDISRPTLYRWIREREDFPRPRKLGSNSTVWIRSELEEWLATRPPAVVAGNGSGDVGGEA